MSNIRHTQSPFFLCRFVCGVFASKTIERISQDDFCCRLESLTRSMMSECNESQFQCRDPAFPPTRPTSSETPQSPPWMHPQRIYRKQSPNFVCFATQPSLAAVASRCPFD